MLPSLRAVFAQESRALRDTWRFYQLRRTGRAAVVTTPPAPASVEQQVRRLYEMSRFQTKEQPR